MEAEPFIRSVAATREPPRIRFAAMRWGALLLVAITMAVLVAAYWASRPPLNLILVSIDTLRADHLGVYGYARDTSPNLDRLARQSAVFDQAISQAPNTPPSQMSLLTSLYYSVHGFTGNNDRLPEERTTVAEWLKAQGFATWGFVDGGYLRSGFGFDQGFDHYDDRPLHLAGILDNATAWMDQHSAERFFLFVHCYDVHSPYAPPAPYDTLFDDPGYQGDFVPSNDNLEAVVHWKQTLSPEDLRHVVALYDGGIRAMDVQLGRFLADLERRGLLRSSVVVITSDHGEEFWEHGSMLHWQSYYSPNLHVPLIVHVPNGSPRRIAGPVELIDVVPTALELLGLPRLPDAMGQSVVARLRNTAPDPERVAYSEPFTFDITTRTVVSDRYQLHYDVKTHATRLFDIRTDPDATTDLSAREPAVVAHLLHQIGEWQERIAGAARDGGTGSQPNVLDAQTRDQLRALGYTN